MMKTKLVCSLVALAAFGAWGATGCSDSPAPPTAAPADAGPDVAVDPGADAGFPIPDTAVGHQLAWLLSSMNGGANQESAAVVQGHFDASFLAAVPITQITALLKDYAKRAPFTLTALEGTPTAKSLAAVVHDGKGAYLRIALDVKAAAPNGITGLLFTPAGDLDPTIDSWATLDTRMKGVSSLVDYLAVEVTDGTCNKPVHGLDAAVARPLGSTFKLYVLGTLARQVEAGVTTWETPLAVRADYKSLPSGTVQTEAVGTSHPLRYFAEKMISISDNTATDHLLYTLGRDKVEESLGLMGHSKPALDTPFMATRELFFLKLAATPTEVEDYIAADATGRRTLLDTKYKPMDISLAAANGAGWTLPRNIDRLEWFATAEDLCRAMTSLRTMAAKPSGAPVLDVLSINPGLQFDKATWPFIGFKGGSEPGVLVSTWLLRRKDNRWFFLTANFDDTSKAIDQDAALYLAAAAAGLLAKEP
jgi:beta-lactamase class A